MKRRTNYKQVRQVFAQFKQYDPKSYSKNMREDYNPLKSMLSAGLIATLLRKLKGVRKKV